MADVADTPDFRRIALAAASAAATGLADVLLAAHEGPLQVSTPYADEAIEKLADATKMAIEASIASGEALDEDRGQLLAALTRYLEWWA